MADKVHYSIQTMPDLFVPSGRIAMVDPKVLHDEKWTTFAMVPPGVYPVRLRIAEIGDLEQTIPGSQDERVAAAVIQLRAQPVAVWEEAECTVPTSSGCVALADSRVPETISEYNIDQAKIILNRLFEEQASNYRHTWRWANLNLGEGNLMTFSSGMGDGVYPVYLGFGRDDELSAIKIDFELFDEEEQS